MAQVTLYVGGRHGQDASRIQLSPLLSLIQIFSLYADARRTRPYFC